MGKIHILKNKIFEFRNEQENDFLVIENLKRAIFGPARFTKAAHFLRLQGNLNLKKSFVCTFEKKIIGSVRVTEIFLEKKFYYFLGPVFVLKDYQGLKIGSKLIHLTIEAMRQKQHFFIETVFLIGDYEYYNRFGFQKMKEIPKLPLPVNFERCLELSLG